MPFLSIEFAIFFLCFFLLYWLARPSPRVQNHLILISSLVWLIYLHWLFALAVVIYSLLIIIIANQLCSTDTQAQRKRWLVIGIALGLLNLSFFKYYDFFRPELREVFGDNLPDIIMPLGISYYTFQSIAYLVSLYREEVIELKWHELLLHLSFFPTITAGPIFRAGNIKALDGLYTGAATQIRTIEVRHMIRPALAISLILLGILKKWWLSGALGDGWVDPVFENPLQYDTFSVLAAIYGYTAQLFFDFSGYTDIVIGIAMLLGFSMPQNFNMPLRAYNIRDFWDRWHITLSTWIRDYIYIPLGGSRKGFIRTQINLLIALVLSGVWHGYGWNFFIWGFLHGIALVLLNIGDKVIGQREMLAKTTLGRAIGIFITINFVCMTFVVFRTATIDDAGLMFQALFNNEQGLTMPSLDVLFILALLGYALVCYRVLARGFNNFVVLLERCPMWLWPLPIAIVMAIAMIFAPSGIPGFIYANF